jgi:4-amino-4-deoxy-L-arabinose transferase-like glycosyltransferase
LVFIAIFIRIGVAVKWQYDLREADQLFAFGDSMSYWTISKNLSEGDDFEYGGTNSRIFRTPLYPLILTPIHWVAKGQLAVFLARILGVFLSVVSLFLIASMARRLAGERASLCAAALFAIYPGAVATSVFVLSEALFCPLMLFSLSLLISAFLDRPRIAQPSLLIDAGEAGTEATGGRKLDFSRSMLAALVMSGVAAGLACLARPSWLLWPGMLLVFLIVSLRSWRSPLVASFCVMAGMSVAMSPWWIRNYNETGEFVPTTLQVGASLYDSFHPQATGASDTDFTFVNQFADEQRRLDQNASEQLRSTFEWRLDQRMRKGAVDWIMQNPSDALSLGLLKFGRTWSPFPLGESIQNIWFGRAEAFAFVVIALLAASAWVWRNGLPGISWVLIMPIVYFGILHCIFVGSIRYRHPPMLAVIVLAGVSADALISVLARFRIFKRGHPDASPSS